MKVQVQRTLKKIVKMRYEDGVLKVVANCFVSQKKLREIIQQNADWIRERKKEQGSPSVSQGSKASLVQRSPSNANSDKSLPTPREGAGRQSKRAAGKSDSKQSSLKGDIFYGRKTVIMGDVISVASSVSAKTYVDGNVLYINEKFCQIRETRLKAIKAYLKKIAQLYVSVEIANFGSNVSLCPAKIEFREVGESWLKCSFAAQRTLCFDFRIVQLPQNIRTYLIAHAFAHFAHPIHDDKFYNFMSNAVPHWRDAAKQLEKYNFLKDI